MSAPELIQQLSQQLPLCLNTDRHGFKRQLDRYRHDVKKGTDMAAPLAALAGRVGRSVALRNQRLASIPPLNFPDLPVSYKKDDIAELIKKHQVVIVCGETGSGKTTQLPKICLSIGRGAAGFIGHTQPRRIAARTVADRIAEELGQKIGDAVGYKVRFNDKTHPGSLVKLMTDGILLAESSNDRYLNQYDTLIIDEAHERSLNIDFLLGYMKWLLPKRPDLKLVITSATIDTQRFSDHFGNAPIIEVSGRTYPVEIRYRPIEAKTDDDEEAENDETTGDLQNAILDAVDELYRDVRGDMLIFLSGEHEIRETAESLRKHHPSQYEILPLYAKLSVSEQERVFHPKGGAGSLSAAAFPPSVAVGGKPRIVLATNVAETSLTVPGIRGVIDTGHARISRYSHKSKIQRLPIERVSQSSANQRAGRCGRVAEGICIRLYSREDYEARPAFTEPEILRTNLSSVILQMAALNLGDIAMFPFIEPPDEKMIRDGKTLLQEVNALDKQGLLTDIGKQLAKFPTNPKLARMLIAAHGEGCLAEVAIIVAVLSIQDPREKPADKMPQAEAKHALFRHPESDFLSLLNLWHAFEEQKKHKTNNKLRQYCKDHFLSYLRMREWHDNHAQIMQIIKGDLGMTVNELKAKPSVAKAGKTKPVQPSAVNALPLEKRPHMAAAEHIGPDYPYENIHRALLTGLLSNIGFRHEHYEYLGARGLKFFIFPGSGLHKVRPKWIMAAEQVETSKVYARTVARIEPEWVEACAGHLVKRSYHDPHWEKKAGRSAVYERTLLYGLTLQNGRKVPYEHIDPKGARTLFIQSALVAQDYHSNAPFFVANKKLLEEVGTIQHKGRRVDLVEDEQWLHQFYDSRLPEEVVNGVTLDQWRKTAEKVNPNVLFLTKEDLTREQEHAVSDWDYPDSKKIGNLNIALQYRFEPGHEEDGVTALVPVHQLNQLNNRPFEWLVPGMLEEKCIALVKALPKQLRKHFVPVPQTVKQCLEIEPDFKGSLYEWLGNRLKRLTGEAIPLTAWNTEALPEHLRMNFRVIDENGKLLDYGRDLRKLQLAHAVKAGDSFDELAADEMKHTGCIGWAFDDLPEHYTFIQKGQSFSGFPAIVDEGDSVGVKMFDTSDKAEHQHKVGLTRLLRLSARKECTYLLKNMPQSPTAGLAYQNLPKHPLLPAITTLNYKEDMLAMILHGVFLEGRAVIRTQKAFEDTLKENKGNLMTFAHSACQTVIGILDQYSQLQGQLKKLNPNDPLALDLSQQLACLVYSGFVKTTPYGHLRNLPRYLQAMQYRLDKRDNNPQKVQEINRYAVRYWKDFEKRIKKESVSPEADAFRWALEELRVSLFAQQLKTAYPVSAKRLDKLWDERGAS